MSEVGLLSAFLAGLASFLSPCVLPLVPGYLSFISGVSVEELIESKEGHTGRVFLRSFLFVLGFSAVFISLGATATTIGHFLSQKMHILNKIAGAMIIIFGLHLTGIFRIKFLMVERRYHRSVAGGAFGAFLLGMAFAFGWTPCVGPVLFAILAYAGTQETLKQGILLLAVYSAGLGIPFLLTGLGTGTFIRFLDRFKKHLRWVEIGGGLLLIIVGLLVMTGFIQKISGFMPEGLIKFG